jgi:hypothetical protein
MIMMTRMMMRMMINPTLIKHVKVMTLFACQWHEEGKITSFLDGNDENNNMNNAATLTLTQYRGYTIIYNHIKT